MALPALLLSAQARKIRPSIGDACVAAAGLVVGVYYWRRGMFPSVLPLVNPGALKVVTLIQVLGASIGWVVVYRLLRESVRGGRSSAAPMLAVVIVAQFAAMPIMQHPLLRHAMPAFVALVALVAIIGIRSALPTRVIAAVLIAAMGFSNAQMTRHTAQVDEAAWQLSGELTKSGVSLEQLDGGWGWFCYYHLHPGLPDTRGYRARYYELRDHARYSVGARPPAPGEIAVHEVNVPAPLFGPSTKIVAVDRMPANNLPTN